MKKRARRTFSPEFTLEAVRVVVEQGRALSQVASELELRPEEQRHWKQQLQATGAVDRPVARLSLKEENRQLRRQLEVARQERDFAKQAAAFFAKDLCWDNAVAESLVATLKRERFDRPRWPTREAARDAIADYIDRWYNPQRRHSNLGYLCLAEYERRQHAA